MAYRTAEQRHYMEESLAQFWGAADHMFALASAGNETEARHEIRVSLQAHQAALDIAVSRQLVANNEAEQQAGERIQKIYYRVQRQVLLFLLATLVPIILTSLYLIRSNRLLFQRLSDLSEQRSELAQKLIATQESTLLHISRELHDEFGQILTAIGSMLRRAGRQAPEGSTLRADLVEVSDIAQATLDKVRSLSQALHPVTLEEAGLESTVDWYLPVVERQHGIERPERNRVGCDARTGGTAEWQARVLASTGWRHTGKAIDSKRSGRSRRIGSHVRKDLGTLGRRSCAGAARFPPHARGRRRHRRQRRSK